MAWIGRFAVRFRYLVIIAWVLVTILCLRALPSLGSVVNSDNSSFLPSSAPSKQAASLDTPFQPSNIYTSVIVAVRDDGPLTAGDEAAITSAETAAGKVAHVRFVHDQGISADGHARKASVGIDVSPSDSRAGGVVDNLRAALGSVNAPAGLNLYLTGNVASNIDTNRAASDANKRTQILTNVVILVMLIIVFRALLAPILTLAPAVLVLVLAGPVIAQASTALGFQVSSFTQAILTVLVLGAGTDYGLFLILRVREELRRGHTAREAVIEAVDKVGESITFSGGTVIGALLCLLLATFGVYRGLGPGLAIAIALMLLAALTLLPALLSLVGHAAFWPLKVEPGPEQVGAWGRIAVAIVERPRTTLVGGVILFGILAAIAGGYSAGGFASNSTGPSGSDSLKGSQAIAAHYPPAVVNPTTIVLVFPTSVWSNLDQVQTAETDLSKQPVFHSVSGLLDPNGTAIDPSQLSQLHAQLGDPSTLAPTEPAAIAAQLPVADYNAYRATAQFISADGRTLQFYTTLAAGDPAGTAAIQAMPAIRGDVAGVARAAGAGASGVLGQAAAAYDISNASNNDLRHIVPVVMLLIALLLALVLRSLVAPVYLVLSVALSYFASLGIAVLIFMHIKGDSGLNFVLPFLMFVFLMALGSDYNILVMSRIREEALKRSLHEAISHALNATGSTVTSAGMILAATFAVVGVTGSSDQIRQLGVGIASGVLLDTFLVRTLLVPSIVVLLGRWNWWPSALARRRQTPVAPADVGVATAG
jgi:RND superfamily putative drug exporter